MKKTYTVIGLTGKNFERTTEREYTHAAVIFSVDNDTPIGTYSFAGRLDLAEKKVAEYQNNYPEAKLNNRYAKVMEVREVVKEAKAPKTTKEKATKELTINLRTFTGMDLGNYPAEQLKDSYKVVTKSNILYFSKDTLTQTNAKNPKFANKIVIVK